jgi:hypothetical protein
VSITATTSTATTVHDNNYNAINSNHTVVIAATTIAAAETQPYQMQSNSNGVA